MKQTEDDVKRKQKSFHVLILFLSPFLHPPSPFSLLSSLRRSRDHTAAASLYEGKTTLVMLSVLQERESVCVCLCVYVYVSRPLCLGSRPTCSLCACIYVDVCARR